MASNTRNKRGQAKPNEQITVLGEKQQRKRCKETTDHIVTTSTNTTNDSSSVSGSSSNAEESEEEDLNGLKKVSANNLALLTRVTNNTNFMQQREPATREEK
jgi:hypothetical protein